MIRCDQPTLPWRVYPLVVSMRGFCHICLDLLLIVCFCFGVIRDDTLIMGKLAVSPGGRVEYPLRRF